MSRTGPLGNEDRPDFTTRGDRRRVEAWSVRRLPFEPKGSMLDLRTAIRAELAGLAPSPSGLHCVYASESTDFCDAENVLLYNVGMSSFGRLTEPGVTIERSFERIPEPEPLSAPARHHHRYAVVQPDGFERWTVDGTVAAWMGSTPSQEAKAAGWWWATRSALAPPGAGAGSIDLTGAGFGLHVTLGPTRRTTAALLKPMLDGVIAALHHDPAPDPEAVSRLARHLDRSEAAVRSELAASSSPLGPRPVVRAYRSGLQWNPADDLCTACRVERHEGSHPSQFEGRLLALTPRP